MEEHPNGQCSEEMSIIFHPWRCGDIAAQGRHQRKGGDEQEGSGQLHF